MDHGAVYEFEPGERVTLYSRLHPTAVPAVVLRRMDHQVGGYVVLVSDGDGRVIEALAGASEMGLRHAHLRLDAIAQERIDDAEARG
jgi:hypothetical protein